MMIQKLRASEVQSQGKFDLTRVQGGADSGEIGVIPHIKELRPELRLETFPDGEAFVKSPVPGVLSGSPNHAGAAIAKKAESGSHEGAGIKPFVHCFGSGDISHAIGSGGQSWSRNGESRVKSESTLNDRNSGKRPVAQGLSQHVIALF